MAILVTKPTNITSIFVFYLNLKYKYKDNSVRLGDWLCSACKHCGWPTSLYLCY